MCISNWLEYNHNTGEILWKRSKSGISRKSRIAGSISKTKWGYYRLICFQGTLYKAHRIAWKLYYGSWPKGVIDHIDGNGLNNKIKNLRDVSVSVNNKNRSSGKNNISGVIGVSWVASRCRWLSTIQVDKKSINLGYYKTKLAASYARHAANIKYGFHTNHGRSGKP